jgi:hypothetical protein
MNQMRKLLLSGIILLSLFSCKKENIEPEKIAVACQCINNAIIYPTNVIVNGKPINEIDTSECSKKRVGTIYIKTWTWINGMPQANNTTSNFTYNYKGFLRYIFSPQELNLIRGTPLTTSNVKQEVYGNAPLPCINNGKLQQSVYCSGITLEGRACRNLTLSCNYRCYLHGGN